MKKKTVAIALAATLVSGLALANDEITGVGGVYWARQMATSVTSVAFDDGSADVLFAAGDGPHARRKVAIITSDASAVLYCQWSIAPDTNVNPATGSPLMTFYAAGQTYHERPNWKRISEIQGETGLCSTAITTGGDGTVDTAEQLYVPCNVDGDCTALSAGTCTSAPTRTQTENAGVYLICEAASGTPNVFVQKQEVEK